MPQSGSADCPKCESVRVSWRGQQAAGVGAPGSSLRPAAEADPAGREPEQARGADAVAGGKKEPGPRRTHPAHVYRPLSGAAGHAGEGWTVQKWAPKCTECIKNLCLRTHLDKDGIVLTGCLLCCCVQACQLAVMTNPRDSHALCLLGLAQLAQYDSNPDSDGSKEAMSDASLSFQASIETENKSQSGEPPEQLTSEFVNSTS